MQVDTARTVHILGQSWHAWAAALYLNRKLAGCFDRIVVVEDGRPGGQTPSIVTARPDTKPFLAALGISEETLFNRTDACFALGTVIEAATPFALTFGTYGASANSIPFHHFWTRLKTDGRAAPFDAYCLAAALCRSGGFVHPSGDPKKLESSFEYGYSLGADGFSALLEAEALRLGVERVSHGEAIPDPWLVLDCRVEASTNEDRVSWPDLPSMIATAETLSEAPAENLSADQIKPVTGGVRVSRSSRQCAVDMDIIMGPGAASVMPGRTAQPWLGGRVKIGPAAIRLPGLTGTDLTLIRLQMELLAGLLPTKDAQAGAVAAEYNRRTTRMFDNAADFEALLWSMQQAAEPVQFASASLARKVEQFRSRGRLVMFDDEIITESEWIAALIGLGHVPERVTPLAIPAPLDAVERNYERLRRAISQAAGSLPRQQVYLDHLMALEGAGPDAV